MKKILLFALLTAALLPAFSQSARNGLRVRTAQGTVEGILEKSGVRSFKGLPFAAPPVGALRWKAPQPAASWTGIRKADQFGPKPMQAPIFGDMGFRSDSMSEDCLYLNVWAPQQKGKELLPVLVYFYGGGFVAGSGDEPRYDGENMATKGIVALTVNYRLGVFGFMAHPELSAENVYKGSGNWGVMDQAAALKWVQENIAAFGGDPKKVTIAGESAGSISVSAQMASPLSRNLIAGAIGESGSLLGALSAVPLADGEKTGVQFAGNVKAANLSELRARPAGELLDASTKFGPFRFSMTVDGYFFPKSPYAIYEAGEQAKVPLLAGWNSEEMNARGVLGNTPATKENWEKAVRRLYPEAAEEVLKAYAVQTDAEVEAAATDLAGDRFISFSTWKWIDLHARTSGQPVYRYRYERPRPAMRAEMGDAAPGLAGGVVRQPNTPKQPPAKGAVHSAEIEYAMGNLDRNKVYAWSEEDYKVSRTMQEYFARFIRTGNPNGGEGLPQWPSINGQSPAPVLHIDVNTRVLPDAHGARYVLLDRLMKK
ncbi:MAG TPA: carboxylesterase family protein [Chitinophagaceae bacterium]|jgi:para-nitrobenzyl esterase|nr:carboxylesterase family protein [Chitinophagaceae bacterium]